MNFQTIINGKTICDSQNNYGAGGAFPALAPIIEDEAVCNLASHLFPELEDCSEAVKAHNIQGISEKARKAESKGVLENGEYPVTVTVDGRKYEVVVNMNW